MPTSGGGERDRENSNDSEFQGSQASRRRFLTGTAGVATAGLAGCLGLGGSDNVDAVKIIAVEGEGRLVERLMNEYVADDTGQSIDVSLFPYANLYEKVSSILTTNGTGYDLLLMDDTWFPRFANYVDPLPQWLPEDLPREQIIDTVLDIATWPTPGAPKIPSAQGLEQQVRGQVIVGNTQMFVFNRSHYEQVGEDPPQTWDDILRAGQQIDQQIDGTSGYVIRGKRGNPIDSNFMPVGRSLAGNMFDEDWRYRWNSQTGRDTVSFFVNDLKSISPNGVTSFDSDGVLNRIADGSAAQALAWPAAASTLLNPDEAEEADNLEFTVIPKGKQHAPTQGNWMFGINKHISDSRKEAAGKVIQSAISKEAQNKYTELGGVPFRHDTFEDNMDAEAWYEALYESLQTAVPRPRTPLWNEIDVTQGQYLNSALAGETSPEKAVKQIESEVESILSDAKYYE